jgi:hypothetical protein
MKYCRNTTLNHPLSQLHNNCLNDINSLIVNEGYQDINPLFTNNEIVINLDHAETIVADIQGRKEKNKSMDMAFGIKNAVATKIQMLLVELKFNVKDVYSLKRTDLEGKVEGSSIILGDIPSIYKRYIFIVKPEHLQEAISRFFRMIPKIESNYIVLDIHLLKAEYF